MKRKPRIKSITTKKANPLELNFISEEDKMNYYTRGQKIPVAEFEIDMGKLLLEALSGKEIEIDEEKLN